MSGPGPHLLDKRHKTVRRRQKPRQDRTDCNRSYRSWGRIQQDTFRMCRRRRWSIGLPHRHCKKMHLAPRTDRPHKACKRWRLLLRIDLRDSLCSWPRRRLRTAQESMECRIRDYQQESVPQDKRCKELPRC